MYKDEEIAVVNRLEVIDHTTQGGGRDFTKWTKRPFTVELSFQDDNRTLKVFLANADSEGTPDHPDITNSQEGV